MALKVWLGYGCLGLSVAIATTCFVLAFFVDDYFDEQIKAGLRENEVMSEENSDTWAYCPGHSRANILRYYYMMNLTNPDEVKWGGAIPALQSKGKYVYLEHDDFLSRHYSHHDGSDYGQVEFRRHQWFDKYGEWDENLSEDDLITSVNLGALGAWYVLKHLPPPTVAVVGLTALIQGLDILLPAQAYAQGIEKLFSSYTIFNLIVFSSAELTKNQTYQLYYDSTYGFGKWPSLQYWVQVVLQCVNNQTFTYQNGLGGTQYVLQTYFGLTDFQMQQLVTNLETEVVAISNGIAGKIKCGTGVNYCPAHFMTVTQWVNAGVSKVGGQPSIAGSNATISGYPELSYFISQNYPNTSAQYNVTFTLEEGMALLDYNLTNGWPSGSLYTLLDTQHMLNFFEFGSVQDWASIQYQFNLSSQLQAEVLFDYMNTLIAITGLQNRTDQAVYNVDNRGITSEVSMGTLVSQTLTVFYNTIGDLIAIALSSTYMFVQYVVLGQQTCSAVVTSAGLNDTEVCNDLLNWTSPTHLVPWIEARWGGVNSTSWLEFQAVSGLNSSQMAQLFNSTDLNSTLSGIDTGIQAHYNCGASVNGTIGTRCFPYELWYRQWGSSEITLNLPPQVQAAGFNNTASVVYLNPSFLDLLGGVPEYYAYALTQNSSAEALPTNVSKSLLTFDKLMSQVAAQTYFIYVFLGQNANITADYGVTDVEMMNAYLRYIADTIALGGLFITRTVDWWLWTGSSPFLQKIAEQNPLLGGNPAQDPSAIQLGQNTTIERLNAYPDQYKSAMATGRNHIGTTLRTWTKFFGTNIVSYLNRAYKGHSPDGPIIVWEYLEPWGERLYINGTDGLSFPPFIDSDTTISLYVDNFLRSGDGVYTDNKYIHGFKSYGFTLSSSLIANATTNPVNSIYNSFGPNGLINITSFSGGPVFGSLSYFYDGDPRLRAVLNFTEGYGDLEDYDTKFYLMHYAGLVMTVEEQLMTNVELKADALYPNIGTTGYNQTGIWTYMPVFNLNRNAAWPKDRLNLIFGAIKDAQLIAEILYYTFFGIFGLLYGVVIVVLGVIVYKKRKAAKRDQQEDEGQSLRSDYLGRELLSQ